MAAPLAAEFVESVPHGATRQEIAQVTPRLLGSLLTVAVSCSAPAACTTAVPGDTETEIGGGGALLPPPPPPPQAQRRTDIARAAKSEPITLAVEHRSFIAPPVWGMAFNRLRGRFACRSTSVLIDLYSWKVYQLGRQRPPYWGPCWHPPLRRHYARQLPHEARCSLPAVARGLHPHSTDSSRHFCGSSPDSYRLGAYTAYTVSRARTALRRRLS